MASQKRNALSRIASLHDIWSKKIDFELFYNITFYLLSDSMDVS